MPYELYSRPSKQTHHLPNAPKVGSHRYSTDYFLSTVLFLSSWFQEISKCLVSLSGAIVQQIGSCHLQEDCKLVNQFEALIFDSLCIIVSSHRYVVLFVGVNFFSFYTAWRIFVSVFLALVL